MKPIFDDYRWLLGSGGRRWLERVAGDHRSEVALAAALRAELSAERAHLVLEQRSLRRRAAAKFAAAERMFFTRIGLEQATDQLVAGYKAERFVGGGLPALDLCCGIGGDLAAMAARRAAVGVDRDQVHALLARENASAADNVRAAVVVADATRLALGPDVDWHIDPDRRVEGRRTTQVGSHSPSSESLEAMLGRAPHGAIKLAPAAVVPEEWADRTELEWIGRQGQCRQLVAWFGRLAREPGRRRATMLRARSLDAEPVIYSVVGSPGRPTRVAGEVGRYVFEPDAAVLAAELAGELARRHSLESLTGGGGYLTGDRPVEEPALAQFEVLDALPFDPRRVKRVLAECEMGRLEIKTRGVPVEPAAIRRRLRVDGDRAGVLLLARRGENVVAIVARRVDGEGE